MKNNISSSIITQLPSHLREDSPIFSEFIQTYYQYVSQRNKSTGIIQNNRFDIDVDDTDVTYIRKFLKTYGEYFPKTTAIDVRNFLKLLNHIYDSKGTKKSLQLIFRLLFNTNVNVSYPKEQILYASSGKWIQESFITVKTIFGEIPEMGFILTVPNDRGNYELTITRIIRRPNGIIRMYYSTFDIVTVGVDQSAFLYSKDGATLFVGQLVQTPSRLTIRYPGTNWQIGNVIAIGDDDFPMIIRVTSVNAGGGITNIEILDNGFVSPRNRLYAVSPYPNKPSDDTIDIWFDYNAQTGGHDHKIIFSEKTNGIFENILGVSNDSAENSYFLEDYVESDYTGHISIQEVIRPPIYGGISGGLSIGDWLASRVIFYYETDYIIKTKGLYKDSSGQLSNPEVRLQDNKYYQNFSYVIETTKDISEYQQILNISHPSGTKRFSNIIKEYEANFRYSTSLPVQNAFQILLKNTKQILDIQQV